MLPRTLNNFNLIIDGRGTAGLCPEITLPKIERDTVEVNNGGMAGPVELEVGIKALSLSFTLNEYNPDVLKNWGVTTPGGINARFLGAAIAGDGLGKTYIEVSVRGIWKSLDWGTVKKKELTTLKVEMPLTYFRYTQDSEPLIEIDMLSGKEVVNGTDLTSEIRQALSLNG